jgi:hypothetical protein
VKVVFPKGANNQAEYLTVAQDEGRIGVTRA